MAMKLIRQLTSKIYQNNASTCWRSNKLILKIQQYLFYTNMHSKQNSKENMTALNNWNDDAITICTYTRTWNKSMLVSESMQMNNMLQWIIIIAQWTHSLEIAYQVCQSGQCQKQVSIW